MRTNHLIMTALTALLLCAATATAGFPEKPVNLGAAGNFVILTKSGISATITLQSAVTGNMGVSPINSTGITGFNLILPAASPFSTSTQVAGKIYAPDYAPPTPAYMTTVIGDMEAAYADAIARSLPTSTEIGTGNISGLTIPPGLHKWGTSVSIDTSSDVTLDGGPTDVWIFQITGDLTLGTGATVLLSGGAQAQNIFWQVAGGSGALMNTDSHMEGIILSKTSVIMKDGASCNGRLYAQTAVTLDHNQVVNPLTNPAGTPLTIAIYILGGDQALLQLVTNAGQTYGVEYKDSLLEEAWLEGSGPLAATANLTQWIDPDPVVSNRYYRGVEITP